VTSGTAKAGTPKLTPTESKRQSKAISESSRARSRADEELTQALSNILINEKIPLDVVNADRRIIIPPSQDHQERLLRKLASV